jgi:hypothetical protein
MVAGQKLNGRRWELARWRQQRGEVGRGLGEARPEAETSLGAGVVVCQSDLVLGPTSRVQKWVMGASGAEAAEGEGWRHKVVSGRRLPKCDARL